MQARFVPLRIIAQTFLCRNLLVMLFVLLASFSPQCLSCTDGFSRSLKCLKAVASPTYSHPPHPFYKVLTHKSFFAKQGQTLGLNIMTIIGTPSFRRCSYTTGPIIGHYVKQRCHPSTPKKSAWAPFLISHRVRLFLGRRESGKAKNLQTVRQMPKQLTD